MCNGYYLIQWTAENFPEFCSSGGRFFDQLWKQEDQLQGCSILFKVNRSVLATLILTVLILNILYKFMN